MTTQELSEPTETRLPAEPPVRTELSRLTLQASLSDTFLQRRDVVNPQCLEFEGGSVWDPYQAAESISTTDWRQFRGASATRLVVKRHRQARLSPAASTPCPTQ